MDDVSEEPSRLFGSVGLLVASFVAAYLPTASQHYTTLRLPHLAFFLAKHFGTGVILSTAFTHLLNSAFRDLGNARWLGYKNWAGFIVMLSIVCMFLVEYASGAYIKYISHRGFELSKSTADTLECTRQHQQESDPREDTPLLLENGGPNEGPRLSLDVVHRREQLLGVLILQMGVMLHSFVLGVTMAVATPHRFASLLPGILFHQTFEGIAIGVRLANIASPSLFPDQPDDAHETDPQNERNDPSGSSASPPTLIHPPIPPHPIAPLPPTAMQRIVPPLFAILFSVPIPFILLLSFFIPALQSRDSLIPPHDHATNTTIASSLLSSSSSSLAHLDPPLTRTVLLQGVTSAVSAGLLIYVSCIELLAGDFLHDANMQKASAKKQGGAIVAFIVGALGMSCL